MKTRFSIKKIFITLTIIYLSSSIYFSAFKDFSNPNYWLSSGLENHIATRREGYYKTELKRFYTIKPVYWYLTQGRYYIYKTDQKLADTLNFDLHPGVVAGILLITIII